MADLASPDLLEEDRHHLTRVLRLRDGELVTASDGAGAWRRCRVAGGALRADGAVESQSRAAPRITVAFAVVKGDRPEWTVQKLTELGVDRIVPLTTDRSVVRWDDQRAQRNVERFRAVARGAAMQSRRVWLPEIAPLTDSGDLGEFALVHPGGARPDLAHPAVAIGPEGGWSDAELARSPTTVDLGPATLRSETAAVTVAAVLMALRAGLVHAGEGKIT